MWRNTKKIRVIGAALLLFLTMITPVIGIGIKSNIVNQNVNNQVFEVNHIDETTIEIIVRPPDLKFSSINTKTGDYTTLELPNEGYSTKIGEAKLPTIVRIIEIPQGSQPEIKIKSVSWEYTSLGKLHLPKMVMPVQLPIPKIPDINQEFIIDEEYYDTNSFLPNEIVKITETGEIRSHRFAVLEISPVQYNPASAEIKILTSCTFQINLIGSNIKQTLSNIERYAASSFEQLLQTTFINYGYYENFADNTPKDQEGYLIIVYDSFFNNIQPLANWKTSKGFDVMVTKTSQISGGATKENIKAYIVDAYNNWPIPPTYVLLVGDVEQIPTWTGTQTGTCTDLYYVTIDQGNYFPDVIISRFSSANSGQATIMADKTIYYEQGNFPDNSWIKKAAFIASDDMGGIAEQTHNYVIDTYLLPNGYTCDKIYESNGGTTAHITNALNDGRSLCVYSGHGSSGGWSCVPFNQNNVQNLQNQGMYPFVCSHACSTNPFNNAECFGETWLRVENKGAIAFWGASASTYWDEDDILEKSMFKAWWEDNLETIGGMTNKGLYYLYQHYSGGGMSKYYFEAYNVLGDSSVKIWRNNPSNPPEKPSTPNGPDRGVYNKEYSFSSSTTEPDGESIFYLFDWDDGNTSEWLGPYNSGETVTASYSWGKIGKYEIRVKAKDINGVQSLWSEAHNISIVENNPPNKPTIDGPVKILPFISYTYTIITIDDDGDNLYYYIDWGGGSSQWIGPYESGQTASVSHKWKSAGTYTIQARAKDSYGDYSEWATFSVLVSLSSPSKGAQNNQLPKAPLKI